MTEVALSSVVSQNPLMRYLSIRSMPCNLGITTLPFGGVNLDQCEMFTSPDFCREATLYNVKQCFGFVTQMAAIAAALVP